MFQTKVVVKIKTRILCSVFFSSANRAVENVAEPDRPQMAVQYCACALYAGQLRLQTTHKNTHRTRNTYCFSTATVVTRTRLNITLYMRCLSCFILDFLCVHQRKLTGKENRIITHEKVSWGGKGTFIAIFRAAHLAVTWSRSLSAHVTVNTLLPSCLVMYLHWPINCNFCTSWGCSWQSCDLYAPCVRSYCGGWSREGVIKFEKSSE